MTVAPVYRFGVAAVTQGAADAAPRVNHCQFTTFGHFDQERR